jgi:hypothetical protein
LGGETAKEGEGGDDYRCRKDLNTSADRGCFKGSLEVDWEIVWKDGEIGAFESGRVRRLTDESDTANSMESNSEVGPETCPVRDDLPGNRRIDGDFGFVDEEKADDRKTDEEGDEDCR